MKRREALKAAGLILGYTATIGTTAAVIGGCSADPVSGWQPTFINKKDAGILKELASTILPGTETLPGAGDVMIEKFMDETITNYATDEEKQMFESGMKDLRSKVKADMSEEEKMDLIKSELASDSDFMKKIHELTVVGFCTSERGSKEVLVFNPIPGKQEGCIPVEDVGGIWYLQS